jgi:hypothetical protein
MNIEDQSIKDFLKSQPIEKAPHDFTQKVMTSVLAEKISPKHAEPGDWIYGLIAAAAVFVGFIVYVIFDKQGLMTYFLKFKEVMMRDFTLFSWTNSIRDFSHGYSISPFWLGVLLIPVLLLIIDKMFTIKNVKTRVLFM